MLNNSLAVWLWEILEMPGAPQTDASDRYISSVGSGFPGSLARSQQRRCYWISNYGTNHRQDSAANTKRPDDVPAFVKQAGVIVGRQQMGLFQERQARLGNSQWLAKQKSSNRIRRNDDRNQGYKRIVNEGPGVNRDLVEAKKKGNQGSQDRVQTKQR